MLCIWQVPDLRIERGNFRIEVLDLPVEGDLSLHQGMASAVADAAWIQESVPERLDIKHKIFAQIQAAAPVDAVIGSSTSGFKPSELQAGASRPGRIVVAHPFNPVYLLPLVELVPSVATPKDVTDNASDILASIGMKPLVIRKPIADLPKRPTQPDWTVAPAV